MILPIDYPNQSRWVIFLNVNGTSFRVTGVVDSKVNEKQLTRAILDFDGDGRADLLTEWHNGGHYRYILRRSIGTSFESEGREWGTTQSEVSQPMFADVNGDLRPDMILPIDYRNQSRWAIFLNVNGTSFRVTGVVGSTVIEKIVALADVNGDGRSDLVSQHTSPESTPPPIEPPPIEPPPDHPTTYAVQVSMKLEKHDATAPLPYGSFDCDPRCSKIRPGTNVNVKIDALRDFVFIHWAGDCGTGKNVTVTISNVQRNQSCSAIFRYFR